MRKIPKPFVVLLLTTAAMITPPRVTATLRQETLSSDKAILLMRLISGYEPPPGTKTYVNLVDLLRTPPWPDAADRQQDGLPDIHVIDSSTGEALNYVVQVTTSDDKKHFQASLEPIDPKTCLPGFFTDDRGIIYVGKGLGCPAK